MLQEPHSDIYDAKCKPFQVFSGKKDEWNILKIRIKDVISFNYVIIKKCTYFYFVYNNKSFLFPTVIA